MTFMFAICLTIVSVLLAWLLALPVGFGIVLPGLSILYAWSAGSRLGASNAYQPLLIRSVVYLACVGFAVLIMAVKRPPEMGGYEVHGFGVSGEEPNFILLPIWLVPAMHVFLRRYLPGPSVNPVA